MNSLYLSISCVLPTISKSWSLPGKCGLAGWGGVGLWERWEGGVL